MPLTVITVTNVPPSLRGDLTKWMQEIATGVYIGNFNSKIREQLWSRVKNSVGRGQATLSYNFRNELGYEFETYQTNRIIRDYDGVQMVYFPREDTVSNTIQEKGFSTASKLRNAKKFSKRREFNNLEKQSQKNEYVILDIETDGLDINTNNIIEIGAIKVNGDKIEELEILVNTGIEIPQKIVALTGITNEILIENGLPISEALEKLVIFIDNLPIIGYSIEFDISFINNELSKLQRKQLINKSIDLMRYVKKRNMFLENYRLETVLKEYGIHRKTRHRALVDAKATRELSMKVNGFLDLVKQMD